jgi:GNAT superfamily N-acetyltransferase
MGGEGIHLRQVSTTQIINIGVSHMMEKTDPSKRVLETHPLTPRRWADFEELFGERGAYGGCWCMWWRISRREFEEQLGDGNRKAMKTIVESGQIPGLLFYLNGKPVAWCSIAPRDSYASLNRSRILKKLDDTPVWSLVCFFVDKEYRNQGFIQEVLRGAITYVRDQGGTVIEAYPTVPKSEKLPPVSSYMGIPAMFEKAGFVEVARPSKSKVVMRYFIE